MKRYQAPSMNAALAAIRAEMGPSALILQATETKRGALGLLGRSVEVVAAVDERAPRPPPRRPAVASAVAVRPKPAPVAVLPPSHAPPSNQNHSILSELRTQILDLRQAFSRATQWPGLSKLAPSLVDLYERLVDQEVEPKLAQALVTTIDGELSLQAAQDERTVLDCLHKHLRQMLPAAGPLAPVRGQPTIVFLVGPTGVGKTTTIAKLAANLAAERHRVALITCDTFRIAAIPQLRTYADILRMPIEVAYTPDELTQKVCDYLDRDFIIVDTPGRSQRNADQLADLKRFVQAVPTRTTLLTIAAGARYRDMLDVVARFGIIPFDGLLLTKLDETTTYGPILNLLAQTGRPITYLTNGQNVPHDIALASSAGLAEMLVHSAWVAGKGGQLAARDSSLVTRPA